MADMKRRRALQVLASTPAVALTISSLVEGAEQTKPAADAAKAAAATPAPGAAAKGVHKPKFFTAHEYATVTMLANIIIPKDDRSGSASDAGVPEFMDYTLHQTFADQPAMAAERQTAMRGGLQWLDRECRTRFEKNFLDCTNDQRTQVLDDIAYPKKAKPELSHGVRFFSMFRDFVATGFYTSKMGIEDLRYMGNVPYQWDGAPAEVLQKLGVSYDTKETAKSNNSNSK
jgi:gluconate 2-dehydrogenase gamma chain